MSIKTYIKNKIEDLETETNIDKVGTILGLVSGILILGTIAYKSSTSGERQARIDQHDLSAIEAVYRPLEANAQKARLERRAMNWTTQQTITNEEGSIDAYFPIENIIPNGNTWTILYTDKVTKEVKSGSPTGIQKIIRDLNPNQKPYFEINIGSFRSPGNLIYMSRQEGKTIKEKAMQAGYGHSIGTIHISESFKMPGEIENKSPQND
jgi:hypothetical protein